MNTVSLMSPLRNDLQLMPGPAGDDGANTWTLHDPLRGRYFRIGRLECEILARWAEDTAAAIAGRVEGETPLSVTVEAVEAVGAFLEHNELCAPGTAKLGQRHAEQLEKSRQSPVTWLLHHYLFVRIPLIKPDHFLDMSLPYVRFVFQRWFWFVVCAVAVVGGGLVLRQWDQFATTFLFFFSWQGAVYYGAALVVAKTIHELGHAYAAKHYGLRVPTMGVAFLVMFPVLYTDTSNAWRLTRRGPLLHIGFAGMGAELALAAFSLLLWNFLPDGPLKSAMFFLSTTTWIMTLGVNLNPLMRFDGYYLLSDYLCIPNLQERAFALARWRLREALFKFGDACPEPLPIAHYKTMLVYAYATWVYRFFLFLGIAVLVYMMFFKALGVLLMVVELWWFIAKPIAREVGEWWARRRKAGLNRNTAVTFLGLCALMALAIVPWQSQVSIPAVLQAERSSALFTPFAARVDEVYVQDGARVAKGAPLVRLAQPELAFRAEQAKQKIEILKWRIARLSGQADLIDEARVLSQQLVQATTALHGLEKELGDLVLVAPFSGTVRDVARDLHVGRWLPASMHLVRVVDDGTLSAMGYVAEQDLTRIAVGAPATFRAEGDLLDPLAMRLVDIDKSALEALQKPYLASEFGGDVAVRIEPESGLMIPERSLYRLTAGTVSASPGPKQMMRGTLAIEGEAVSLLGRVLRFAAGVLIRESGV